MAPQPILSFVVPCYNEQAVLPHTLRELLATLGGLVSEGMISENSYLFFVDDGSQDDTWNLIEKAHAENPKCVRGLKLSRNVGHQNALLAGLLGQIGRADAVISLDADLQDNVAITKQMINCFVSSGADIVFGVRSERATDTVFKRKTAQWYYRFLRWLGVEIVLDHGDFRLISDRALRALAQFGEVHVFLRGLVMQLGFKTELVYFERKPRAYGETKYTLSKMLAFASDGITSFSIRPLRVVTTLGLILFALSIVALIWVLAAWLVGRTIEGWASLMVIFLLVSSFQTLALGIIGEYVGKTYFETKSRPRYIVEKELSS
ncbi:MAG: glycosyltransferase family 2 protein [Rhizobiales bacterium]|nr:glycosyltransferase family 2 protein [Hyphomicrobiales bacterium]